MKRQSIFIGIFIFLFTSIVGILQAQTSTQEREALVAIYEATDGDKWNRNDNWLVGDPCENSWYGVRCEEGKVVGLGLGRNNLSGDLPPEIGNLTYLELIHMQHNLLTSIPPEIGNLSNLNGLVIDYNSISEVPPEIGNLGNLGGLILDHNQLSTLPSEVGNLSNLLYLGVEHNQLSSLPSSIGNLKKVHSLYASNNQITYLPPEIGGMTDVKDFVFHHNQLTNIPSEVGNMESMTLFWVAHNQLTSLPSELGTLSNSLNYLIAESNQIQEIPSEIGNLSELRIIQLQDNQLLCLPIELQSLCSSVNTVELDNNPVPLDWEEFCSSGAGACGATSLEEHDALVAIYHATDGPNWNNHTNWLDGDPCENEWYGVECEEGKIVKLDLDDNNLMGDMPQELGNLIHLERLDLDHNELTSIPNEIENLKKVTLIGLYWNMLTSLPPGIGGMEALRALPIYGNLLTTLPKEIGDLNNLEYLGAEDNMLSTIPDEIGNLSNLTDLYLERNQLTSLPSSIGNLNNLYGLFLIDNELSSLPSEIENLDKLQVILMSGNKFSSLPAEMANMEELKYVIADNNEIEIIPSEIGYSQSLIDLNLKHNQLAFIPPEIGNIPSLRYLRLANNELSCLPIELQNLCSSIIRIDLENNRVPLDWEAFCEDGTAACGACDISEVTFGDPYNCNPISDTYSRDIIISYEGGPLPSYIQVMLNQGGFVDYPITGSPQTITLEALPSNGQAVEVFVKIEDGCTYHGNPLFINPQNCSGPPTDCDIINITSGTQSCDEVTNTYEQEVIVHYENEPQNGYLAVEVNREGGWRIYPITESPQSILLEDLPANGQAIDIFAKFTDDNGCTFSAEDLFTAPTDCGHLSSEVSFTLIDAENDTPINEYDPISEGAIIDLSNLPSDQLNIRANTGTLNTVGFQFTLTGQDNWNKYESQMPYALFGDKQEDYYPWVNGSPKVGAYSLTGIPKLEGWIDGEAFTLNFSFIESSRRISRSSQTLDVYPNPFNYELNIDLPEEASTKVSISLLNMLGQAVYHQSLRLENNNRILPGYLPNGIYTLRIEGENFLYTKRIMKN